MSLTTPELDELHRVSRSPDGQVVLRLLEKRLAEHDKAMRTADGNEVFRAQGKAQAIQQLIDDITQAGEILQRVKQVSTRQFIRRPGLTG